MLKVKVNGLLKAEANHENPLLTNVSLILTDFAPNGNGQGIPESEADNIIKSALYQPLKIDFDGETYYSHSGAIPLGPIVQVYRTQDGDRDVIAAKAVIWNTIYEDASEYLREQLQEGIGTSWEIYYTDSTKDDYGNEWLHNCAFAGTCIVEVPAYGKERTRVLAIAEQLRGIMEDENTDTPIEETEADTNVDANVETPIAVSESEVDKIREDITEASDLVFRLYEGLDSVLGTLYDIEQEQVETSLASIADNFAEKINSIMDRINELKGQAQSSMAQAESLQAKLDQIESEKASAALLVTRRNALAEIGLSYSDEDFNTKSETILGMTDDMFNFYLGELKALKPASLSTSEKKTAIVPEPVHSNSGMTPKEIAAALLNEKGK